MYDSSTMFNRISNKDFMGIPPGDDGYPPGYKHGLLEATPFRLEISEPAMVDCGSGTGRTFHTINVMDIYVYKYIYIYIYYLFL